MITGPPIPVENLSAAMAEFAGLLESAPLTESMTECKATITQGVRGHFNSSAGPDNVNWPPRKKRKGDDGHPLLIDTGALMQAATGGGAGHISKITEREVETGVNPVGGDGGRPFAAVHQRGSVEKNIPARPFMGASVQTLDTCGEAIADDALGKIFGGKAGGAT